MRWIPSCLLAALLLAPCVTRAEPVARVTVEAMDALAAARLCRDDLDCLIGHGVDPSFDRPTLQVRSRGSDDVGPLSDWSTQHPEVWLEHRRIQSDHATGFEADLWLDLLDEEAWLDLLLALDPLGQAGQVSVAISPVRESGLHQELGSAVDLLAGCGGDIDCQQDVAWLDPFAETAALELVLHGMRADDPEVAGLLEMDWLELPTVLQVESHDGQERSLRLIGRLPTERLTDLADIPGLTSRPLSADDLSIVSLALPAADAAADIVACQQNTSCLYAVGQTHGAIVSPEGHLGIFAQGPAVVPPGQSGWLFASDQPSDEGLAGLARFETLRDLGLGRWMPEAPVRVLLDADEAITDLDEGEWLTRWGDIASWGYHGDPDAGDDDGAFDPSGDGHSGGDGPGSGPDPADESAPSGPQMTVTTQGEFTLDGTPKVDLLDTAAGVEVVVDGVLHHRVELEVPGGRGAHGPRVAIDFQQGAASAELGRHWRLAGTSSIVRRQGDGGQPRGDGSDVFFIDGDRLVPVPASGPHHYRRRARTDELFVFWPAGDRWTVHRSGRWREFGRQLAPDCGMTEQGTAPVTASHPAEPPSPEELSTWPGWDTENTWTESAPGPEITTRWWLARDTDEHGNAILFHYLEPTPGPPPPGQAPFVGTVLLDSITWGEGALEDSPSPQRAGADRDYALEFEYARRPGSSFVARAGAPGWLASRLTEVRLVARQEPADQQVLRRWSFDYLLTVPGRQILLRDITLEGRQVHGVAAEPQRLRRFHYHAEWGEPLQPEQWEGMSPDELDQAMRSAGPTAPLWDEADAIALDVPETSSGYHRVATRFIHADHDALPDALVLRALAEWIPELAEESGSAQILCSDQDPAEDTDCPVDASPYDVRPPDTPVCAQAMVAEVHINGGTDSSGVPVFTFDPAASEVLTAFLQAQGPPTSSYLDLLSQIVIADFNGDGMGDLVGPNHTLSSPGSSGWHSLAPQPLPTSPSVGGDQLWFPVDIDGDGRPERVYPPAAETAPFTSIDMAMANFQITADDPGAAGGLCVVPPIRPVDAPPVWTAGSTDLSGDPDNSWIALRLPFFGGPGTGLLDEDIAAALDAPVLAPFPMAGLCDIDGAPGWLISSQYLAGIDHRVSNPWLTLSGWEYLAQHLRLTDVNGDGCADASMSIELQVGLPAPGLAEALGADDGWYSEVWYGDCAGGFLASGGQADPAEPRRALGAPSSRARWSSPASADCADRPYRGLALATACGDEPIPQPWAAPWCELPYGDDLCCHACGGVFAECSEGEPQWDCPSEAPPSPDSYPLIPEDYEPEGQPEFIPTLWDNEPYGFDPLLRHRWSAGLVLAAHGPSSAGTVGGQWVDTDADGIMEWLQVCTSPGRVDPMSIPLSEGQPVIAEPADEADAIAGWPLALHFPQDHGSFGPAPGATCDQLPVRTTDLAFVGGFAGATSEAFDPLAVERPLPRPIELGADHLALLLDLDGDAFPDHVRSDGDRDAPIQLRRSTRALPESTLVAITWPTGDHAPGTPLSDATGTSYLGWRTEDPGDHPLLPFPSFGLAEVLDATGHRVFQRFGCRIHGRRFSGCAAVVAQGPRGGLFKTLHSTHSALPGFRWAEARYTATGQLVDLALSLPREEPLWPTYARWPERSCTVAVPEGSFDGSLQTYLSDCAAFSSSHPGAQALNPADLTTFLYQEVDREPLDLAIAWPGLDPSALGWSDPALPYELKLTDLELDPGTMRPLFAVDHGAASTLDDDRVTSYGYGAPEPLDGPRLTGELTQGAGAYAGTLSELEYGWTGWSRTSTTRFGGPDGPVTSTLELDAFGRRLRATDADGVSSVVDGRDGCGGVTGQALAEQLGSDSPTTAAAFDAACDRTWEAASSGVEQTIARDGLGRVRLTTIEPRGSQPAMRTWTLRSWDPISYGDPSVPQRAVTDGESLSLEYIDERGQTWQTTRCQLAGAPPTDPASVLGLEPADLACVAGTEVDRLLFHDNGLLVLESDPFPAAQGPSLWTRHEHDSLRRPVAARRLLGSEQEALDDSAQSRLLTTRTPLHDGELVVPPTGVDLRTTLGPLTRTTSVDGIPIGEVRWAPDGLPEQTTDAEGRVTRLVPDGLRRPWQTLLPSFVGADASGATVTWQPTVQTGFTPAGRVVESQLPDGSGVRTQLDPGGRSVGAETLSGAPLWAVDLPVPLAPGAPTSATQTTTRYDADGDPLIEQTDGLGRVVARVFADGTSSSSEHDASGRLVSHTDRAGRKTGRGLEHLPDGRVRETVTHADGATDVSVIDHRGNPLRQVDRDGVFLSWVYDDWGRPTQRWLGGSDPESLDPSTFGLLEVSWTWNDLDQLVSECPAGGACTTYTWDARGREDVIQVGAQTWQLTWSDADELLAAELLVAPFTRLEWFHDDAGHLRQEFVGGKSPGWMDYDAMGRASRFSASVAGMPPERWVYDDQGRLAEHHQPGAALPTLFGYHPDGALQRVDDGFGALDGWYEYDALGRPELEENASGRVDHHEYDGPDLAASWWEDGGTGEVLGRVEYELDPATGRLATQRQAIDLDCAAAATPFGAMHIDCASVDQYAEQSVTFSPAGRQLSRTDPEGSTSTWTWDDWGRVTGQASELLTESFAYDADGRLQQVQRGAPDRYTQLQYDAEGRLIEAMHVQDGQTETESWLHDALGRTIQASVERDGATVEDVWTSFDPRGLIRQQVRSLDGATPAHDPWNDLCDAGELCFDYDELGRRTRVVWPDQRGVTLTHGSAGLDRVVEGAAGPSLYEVHARDMRGRPERTWRSGDVLEELRRGPDGAVEQRSIQALSAGPSFVDVALERDVVGRLTSRRTTSWGASSPFVPRDEAREYAWDAAGQLTWEAHDGQEWGQTFDRAGNRLSRTDLATGEGFTASYGPDNRLLSIDRTDASGPFPFSYDALGRRTTDEKGHELVHSPRGRLEAILDGSASPVAEYAYGVDGGRVRETTSAGMREFTYGPGSFTPWVTSDAGGDWNELIVGGSSLLTLEPSSGPSSTLRDGAGSPLLRADVLGRPSWTGTWDTYGAPMASAGLPPTEGWKGMLPTQAPGIPYLAAGHRDYDPITGTWLQPDPLGSDGDPLGNVYRFAGGDPVNLADPSGLCADMTWQAARSRHTHMRMLTGRDKGMPTLRGITSGLYMGPSLTGWLKNTPRWRDPDGAAFWWDEVEGEVPGEEKKEEEEPSDGSSDVAGSGWLDSWEWPLRGRTADGTLYCIGCRARAEDAQDVEESEEDRQALFDRLAAVLEGPNAAALTPHTGPTVDLANAEALEEMKEPATDSERPATEPASVKAPAPAFSDYDQYRPPADIDGANSDLMSGEGSGTQRIARSLRAERRRQARLGFERYGPAYHLVGVPQAFSVEMVAGSLSVGDGLGMFYGSMFTDTVRLNLGWGDRFSLASGVATDIAAIGGTFYGLGAIGGGGIFADDLAAGGGRLLGLLRRGRPGGDAAEELGPSARAFVERMDGIGGRTVRAGDVGPQPRTVHDLAVKPGAPKPKPLLGRRVGRSPAQNRQVQADAAWADSMGATDIRINQQQIGAGVDAHPGARFGINRPDLQFTLDGVRLHIEYDRAPATRALPHAIRLLANDPDSIVVLLTM